MSELVAFVRDLHAIYPPGPDLAREFALAEDRWTADEIWMAYLLIRQADGWKEL